MVGLSGMSNPHPKKDTSIKYDTDYFPEAKNKGQTSLWVRSNYDHTLKRIPIFFLLFQFFFNSIFFFHFIHSPLMVIFPITYK